MDIKWHASSPGPLLPHLSVFCSILPSSPTFRFVILVLSELHAAVHQPTRCARLSPPSTASPRPRTQSGRFFLTYRCRSPIVSLLYHCVNGSPVPLGNCTRSGARWSLCSHGCTGSPIVSLLYHCVNGSPVPPGNCTWRETRSSPWSNGSAVPWRTRWSSYCFRTCHCSAFPFSQEALHSHVRGFNNKCIVEYTLRTQRIGTLLSLPFRERAREMLGYLPSHTVS